MLLAAGPAGPAESGEMMNIRRPPRKVVMAWITMGVILIIGLLLGPVNRTVGASLFLIGFVGYMGGGIGIFIVYPRRPR
jgi:hypothetical protein